MGEGDGEGDEGASRRCIVITPFLPSSPLFVRYQPGDDRRKAVMAEQPVDARINRMMPKSTDCSGHYL
jgi:hypothetical protein